MGEDIITLLQTEGRKFSRGQRRIKAYILESYDKAAFMTACRLGDTVGVSESTVVRFAMELGFEGYPEMQRAMQDMVLNRLTTVQRIGMANDRIGDQDVVSKVLQADAEKLRKTGEILSREEFAAAVQAILNARQIYILGVRSAAPLANFLSYYMNYMFDNVHTITSSSGSEIFERLLNVTSDDVLIAFSFPRYSTSTVKGAQYCRSVGATVVGLTNTKSSPLADNSDYSLIAKSDMASMVDSLVAPLSVVNALIVALATKREEILKKNFDTLERVWEEYHVYEKRTD